MSKTEFRRLCAANTCRKPLTRREGERPSQFAKRQTCGGSCIPALTAQKIRAGSYTGPKSCPICGEVFDRRDNEPQCEFRDRQTCSLHCARKLQHRNLASRPKPEKPKRYCQRPGCDNEIKHGKRFCSHACSSFMTRIPEEEKKSNQAQSRKNYESRRKKRARSDIAPKRVVDNKIRRPRPEGTTVFGDKDPGTIWRPASLGGPIPRQTQSA